MGRQRDQTKQTVGGRQSAKAGQDELVRPSSQMQALAFSGIHVISPRLLPLISEEGVFSIIDSYVRLAGEGGKIAGFRADEYYWRDVGKLESLKQAEQETKH